MTLIDFILDLNARVRSFKDSVGLTGGGATKLDGVLTRATATITFSANPSAAHTITLNGTVWTFVASGAAGNQTNIQGTLALTLTQLASDLNGSGDTQVSKCVYSVSTTVLTIAYKNGDSTANAFTVASSSTNGIPSSPNLVGGLDYGDANQGGVFCPIILSNQMTVYRLRSGTDAESSPNTIRPDDYDGTNHQRVWVLQNIGGSGGSFLPLAGGSMTGAINEAKGADIASASTTNIGAASGNFIHVTGTTTITAFDTVQAGTERIVEFTGALTLTHNGTSLILPGAANITTAAGDTAIFVSEGSGNWRCVLYMPAAWFLKLTGGTLTGALTVSGARVSARNFLPSQSSQTFGATPTFDFDGDEEKTMTVTAAITSMTTSNRAAGKQLTIFFLDDGGAWAIAGNGSWQPISGATIPTNLTASKRGILTLKCVGTNESDVISAFKMTA